MADGPCTGAVARRGAVVLWAGLVVAAVWTDVTARTRAQREEAALAAARAHLETLRHDEALTRIAVAITTGKRNASASSIATTMRQLTAANGSLASTQRTRYLQGASIATLQTCSVASRTPSARSPPRTTTRQPRTSRPSRGRAPTGRRHDSGLVYPFDFPDPSVILVGQTYYAYATNSVAGNIQIITSPT